MSVGLRVCVSGMSEPACRREAERVEERRRAERAPRGCWLSGHGAARRVGVPAAVGVPDRGSRRSPGSAPSAPAGSWSRCGLGRSSPALSSPAGAAHGDAFFPLPFSVPLVGSGFFPVASGFFFFLRLGYFFLFGRGSCRALCSLEMLRLRFCRLNSCEMGLALVEAPPPPPPPSF